MFNEESRPMVDPISVHGIANFVFPFSFPEAGWLPPFDETREGRTPETHKKYLRHVTEVVTRHFRTCEWGLTWTPANNWAFTSCIFGDNSLKPSSPDVSVDCDVQALRTLDGFYFLAEALRRHPLLRVRLGHCWQVMPITPQSWGSEVSKIKVDVSLFPSLGQGCLCFRCTVSGVGLDEFISLRQTQFRRGVGVLFQKVDSSSSPMEFQDVYAEYCERLLGAPFVAFSDVRTYGASIEIFELRNAQKYSITAQEAVTQYRSQIYGLLCCDEGWRDTKPDQVDESLREMSFSTREHSIDYCQEVTFLKLTLAKGGADQRIANKPLGVVEEYGLLARDTSRSVANGCNYFEVVTVMLAYLQSIARVARRSIAKAKPPRRELIRLRKRALNARVVAADFLNVFTGLPNTLEHARGLETQAAKLGDALNAIESIIDEYRFLDGEAVTDVFTAAAMSTSIAAFAASTRLAGNVVAMKIGAVCFAGIFGVRRLYSNRLDPIGLLALLLALAAAAMFFWM